MKGALRVRGLVNGKEPRFFMILHKLMCNATGENDVGSGIRRIRSRSRTGARTVLAGKGSPPRQTPARTCLLREVPASRSGKRRAAPAEIPLAEDIIPTGDRASKYR